MSKKPEFLKTFTTIVIYRISKVKGNQEKAIETYESFFEDEEELEISSGDNPPPQGGFF